MFSLGYIIAMNRKAEDKVRRSREIRQEKANNFFAKHEGRIKAVIGTLSHNRDFRPSEITEYTRFDTVPMSGMKIVNMLLRRDLIGRRDDDKGRYHPTTKGWDWLEKE